ncbi:MAG: hypothetical protein ACK5QX_02800, partial [bacterium]
TPPKKTKKKKSDPEKKDDFNSALLFHFRAEQVRSFQTLFVTWAQLLPFTCCAAAKHEQKSLLIKSEIEAKDLQIRQKSAALFN